MCWTVLLILEVKAVTKTGVVPALMELTDQGGKMVSTNHISTVHINCKFFEHTYTHSFKNQVT